jgi:hypothetical protein
VKRLLLAICTYSLLVSSCSGVLHVDEVTVVNNTAYSARVEVTDKARGGWLPLSTVHAHSTRTTEEVIDQGDVWIFRFDYLGKHAEEIEVSRNDLEGSDWTVSVPQIFDERLREMGVPPPP